MAINSVTLSGNLVRDPEMRQTASGMAILSFCIAVNERRKNNQTGDWDDYANFVDCTMFGKRAEAVSKHLSKGAKVSIAGKLRYSSWETDGQKRSKLEVIVDEIEFMSRKQEPKREQPHDDAQYVEATYYDDSSDVYDEDIPF